LLGAGSMSAPMGRSTATSVLVTSQTPNLHRQAGSYKAKAADAHCCKKGSSNLGEALNPLVCMHHQPSALAYSM
jgi:hypothetical protein